MTPEGRVKNAVKDVLNRYKPAVYYNMPVPSGYGAPMLDFVGCAAGHFWAVETKAPGKTPTPRQNQTIDRMRAAGGAVFVIDGDTGLREFAAWLRAVMGGLDVPLAR